MFLSRKYKLSPVDQKKERFLKKQVYHPLDIRNMVLGSQVCGRLEYV